MTLNEFFAAHPKCALGFSGGVDSAYLLYAGVRAGADIRPYYIKTAFQPRFEQDDALRLAGELGVEVTVLELDALADPRVAANPAERCYYCKQNLFRALKARAAADGYAVLLDGTNASDEAGDRPGMRALRELEVRSPLSPEPIYNSFNKNFFRLLPGLNRFAATGDIQKLTFQYRIARLI